MKKTFTFYLFAFFVLTVRVAAQPCSDLFLSEYIEGTSFNKAIEIYNPTTGTVDLSGYQLLLFSNGAPADSPSFKFTPSGQLASHDVYVISHPDADSLLVLPLADTTNLVCNWNGNDAIALVNKTTGDTIDIIGVIGEDPIDEWTVGSGSTKDHTLVRMMGVQEGTEDWTVGSMQWDVYPLNDFSHLGSHSADPCAIVTPELAISIDSAAVPENVGSFMVKVTLLNPNANATSADVTVTGGTATDGTDFTFSGQTVTFPSGNSTPVFLPVTITNDMMSEPNETIEFSLLNPTNGATIAVPTIAVKIIDDDGLAVQGLPVAAAIQLYPNPARELVNVNSDFALDEISVEDVLGNKVIQLFTSGNKKEMIATNNWKAGVYIVKIYGNGFLTTRVMVKN
jgi:hypothetical protein